MTKKASAGEILGFSHARYDFHDDIRYAHLAKPGLDEKIVRSISEIKNEPEWMLDLRLKALKAFRIKPFPRWGADLSKLDFKKIRYYASPTEQKTDSWEMVPKNIKKTFDRLGIPEAERRFLGGASAQYDSEVVYHHLRKEWESQGVVFLDMDSGLREYPEIVKKHFGSIIPINDNKFSALNTAVWSGGSFVFVPKGVKVKIPLQAYFRINTKNAGQFERTMIIAEEGASVHYVEGCFTAGTEIHTQEGTKKIEAIRVGDKVLSHLGKYQKVRHTQIRPYTGELYRIFVYSNPNEPIEATDEHPFLCVSRERKNERNRKWCAKWTRSKDLNRLDYLLLPRRKGITKNEFVEMEVADKRKGRAPRVIVRIPSTPDFFRLAGYYISEGSISSGAYLSFSFGIHEKKYIEDVKRLLKRVFAIEKISENRHKTNNGISLVVSSVRLCRAFDLMFGKGSQNKRIPEWMMCEDTHKQKQLIIGLFLGDGNYYRKNTRARGWLKEVFRLNTVSPVLAKQTRDILLRLGIAAFINTRDRTRENRKTMYTVGVTGEYMVELGKMFGIEVNGRLNGKKRATMFHIDENYIYMPIKKIEKRSVESIPVYNFSVEEDESYVANNVAAHNCSAPIYSASSLHAAVVEILAGKGSHIRYTTIQNWSNNVYNLVTKRAVAHEDAFVEWLDGNIGSKVNMKYPGVILRGERARGQVLSVAYAGKGQVQDAGAKMIHEAPNTISQIISKSISQGGGRTSYRGLVKIAKGARNCKSFVQCDAYMLDGKSRSDTYPTIKVDDDSATVAHEARVGKIAEEKLFYLMSRGIPEKEALAMIVLGFIESFTKELPMEYAVELNRLIEMQLEHAVG